MKITNIKWVAPTALGLSVMAMPSAIAQEITPVNALDINTLESSNSSMSQVTSVSQLSDVQPTDWAFQALQSLVERYGCIAGYPDGTYRGNRALTRYEFAAGLNACLDRVNELLAAGLADKVSRDDLAVLERLQEEFAAELATLRGRVDALEARVAEVEANQFSTTTKLQGEVAFTVANAFGEDVDSEVTFTDRVRLQLLTSFTGRDRLITRLTAGNVGNSFVDEIGTNEGRLAYDGQTDNDITLDRLHYVFPVFDDLEATVMASLGGHHFYAETFNPGLEAGGGANGALSRFGERNPIYRLGLGGRGVGFNYTPNDTFEVSAGYIVLFISNLI
ncbi:MAG: iron uptake porin [Symploca sp. SIO2B6]|nr:iron uptake porin [Symploca sp. SIO2B6]